jgi:hypothetical protein
MKPVASFHESLQDRIAAANCFVEGVSFNGEVVVDSMDDIVMDSYDAYPERIVVIQRGVVIRDGGEPDIFGMQFDILGVLKWLKQRRADVKGGGCGDGARKTGRGMDGEDVSCAS